MSSSPAPARPAAHDGDVHSIQSLLASLALAQSESQSALVASFDARNSALWDSIESSIRAAEQEEGEKRKVLEDQRRKGEEAEKKAREMREAEERKKAQELEDEQRRKLEDEQRKAAIAKKDAEEQAQRELEARVASEQAAATAAAEGESPQADWQRWTAKMTVRVFLVVCASATLTRSPCAGDQGERAARGLAEPGLPQGVLHRQARHHAQDRPAHLVRVQHRADHPEPARHAQQHAPARGPGGLLAAVHLDAQPPRQGARQAVRGRGHGQDRYRVPARPRRRRPPRARPCRARRRPHGTPRQEVLLGHRVVARQARRSSPSSHHLSHPHLLVKMQNQTIEQYEKTLGRAKREANESSSQYASRMAGYMALYASIIQTSPLERPQGPCPSEALALIPPHFRPSAGWRWLVLALRAPLISHEAAPALLVAFLEIAGETLLAIYGRQMGKFLEVLLREGIRGGKAGFSEKAKSSTVRLQLWLEEWEKTGRVEQTAGRTLDR